MPVEITISLLKRVRSVDANQFKPARTQEFKSTFRVMKNRVWNFPVEDDSGV